MRSVFGNIRLRPFPSLPAKNELYDGIMFLICSRTSHVTKIDVCFFNALRNGRCGWVWRMRYIFGSEIGRHYCAILIADTLEMPCSQRSPRQIIEIYAHRSPYCIVQMHPHSYEGNRVGASTWPSAITKLSPCMMWRKKYFHYPHICRKRDDITHFINWAHRNNRRKDSGLVLRRNSTCIFQTEQ